MNSSPASSGAGGPGGASIGATIVVAEDDRRVRQESKTLDVYVGYLRRKTEQGGAARIIHTVRGIGYVARIDT